MPVRIFAAAAGAVALVAVVVIGLLEAGGSASSPVRAPTPAATRAELRGSPPALATLHAEAGELLPGGAQAFKQRLATLRGHPVVVNKWASWCPPCRAEFPLFERASADEGRSVAFLGVDSSDNDGAARAFLARYPVSYPSYSDPQLNVAEVFSGAAAYPTTAFYDARGKLQYIHQGEYPSEAKLRADIARYAIDA